MERRTYATSRSITAREVGCTYTLAREPDRDIDADRGRPTQLAEELREGRGEEGVGEFPIGDEDGDPPAAAGSSSPTALTWNRCCAS
jgi:hypothetical protein